MPAPKLPPKPVSPIVDIALKLRKQGYSALWLYRGKAKPPAGWVHMRNEPQDIVTWRGLTAGVAMHRTPGLFAIDLDVQRQDALDRILTRWQARWPEFIARCVIRHSNSTKIMLIGRLKTVRKHMHSARFEDGEWKGGHRVELFTSNDVRYIAVWGMHSEGRDYGYDGPTLWETRLEELPEFLDADLNELLAIAEEELAALGLQKVEDGGEHRGDVAYDLQPEQTAELQDGRVMTLTELEDECVDGFVYVHGRLFDAGSDSYRVKAKVTSMGLTLWDFGTDVVHYWAHLGYQPEELTKQLQALAADMATPRVTGALPPPPLFRSVVDVQAQATVTLLTSEVEPPDEPPAGADHTTRLTWLQQCYGYCVLGDTVIELFEAGPDCELKPVAFERRFAAWYREEPTRGGVRRVPATDDWALIEQRVHVEGARMHPGKNFPLFREQGKLWKNTYRRPVHVGAGEIDTFMNFFERFIPDQREREWMLNWMAHKQARPEIPGSAVIFVADDDDTEADTREGKYGTGRGLFFKIAHLLYGPNYSRAQQFSILEGSSSQSVYNSWIHGQVLTTVDETKTSATAHRRGEKKSVYEVMKDIVDPSPKRTTFHVKYGRSFFAWTFCSYWLASNHADALSIPVKDRRFTILNNGEKMTPEAGRALAAWMEVEGNIAELSRFLAARSLTEFDMFQNLETRGKQRMIELNLSTVEEVLIGFMDDPERGLLFTRRQLMSAVEDVLRPWERKGGRERRRDAGQWTGEFAAAWRDYCVRPAEEVWRVRMDGTQVKLYCFRKHQKAAAQLPEARRRHEAAKWGGVETLKEQIIGLTKDIESHEKDE